MDFGDNERPHKKRRFFVDEDETRNTDPTPNLDASSARPEEHEGEEGHEYDVFQNQRQESPLDEINRAFGVFMPAIGTRLWLDRLQKFDFDIFKPELLRSDWKLPWKSYLAYTRKTL
jgi:hypothetical protein